MQQGGPCCVDFTVTNRPAEVTSPRVCQTDAHNATAGSEVSTWFLPAWLVRAVVLSLDDALGGIAIIRGKDAFANLRERGGRFDRRAGAW
jgi:hypothetical protein